MRSAFLLQHLLEASARDHPQRQAVDFAGSRLTYAQLDDLSSRLAVRLQEAGVRPGERVGLLARKGVEAVAGMLGALKAGAAYVPLDIGAPTARLAYILADCGIRNLLLTSDAAGTVGALEAEAIPLNPIILEGDHTEVDPSRLRPSPAIETDLAYILYTSGSTGVPKGVTISHLNALTFIRWCQSIFDVQPEDRLSNHAPLHFDLSVLDIYCALQAGACVLPVPEDFRAFPVRLGEWIEAERISIWYSVPSALTLLALHGRLERRDLSALRLLLFAGEVFPLRHLQELAAKVPGPRYFNLYGPTETNVCTYHEVDLAALPGRTDTLPIGRACANMAVFAVTDEGPPAAEGEEGELLVAGSGVATGYWGLAERTAAVFVQNPLEMNRRDIVYRTGDLVTLGPDREYRYLGRRDQQVKIRGYRIELGEIESAIYKLAAVREAAVIALPDELAGARLHSVIVPAEGASIGEMEVRAQCALLLPPYMIPVSFEFVDSLPRNSNGKVDRGALLRERIRR